MNTPDRGELIVYRTVNGQAEVRLQTLDGPVWLNQGKMAEQFDTTKQNVSLHIKNILKEGGLPEAATVKDTLTVQTEGSRRVQRKTYLYNLHMILAIGCRVRRHDVIVAKNYLSADEVDTLNRLVVIFLEGMIAGIGAKKFPMNTHHIIDRIFKDSATKYELTEFENLGKAIHDIRAIYPKTAATGRNAGKTKNYLKSLAVSILKCNTAV